MYASSERSFEVSQNSAIISANRLTLATARACSLASNPERSASRYEVLSISSKNRSRTSRLRDKAASSSSKDANRAAGFHPFSASSGAAPSRSRSAASAALGSSPSGGGVDKRGSAPTRLRARGPPP